MIKYLNKWQGVADTAARTGNDYRVDADASIQQKAADSVGRSISQTLRTSSYAHSSHGSIVSMSLRSIVAPHQKRRPGGASL